MATFVEEPFMVVISASAPPETAAVLIPELLVYPGTSIPTTYNIYELSVSNEAAVATTAEPPEVAAFAAEPPEVVAFAAEPPEVVAFAAEPPEVVAFAAEPPEVAAFAAEPPEAVVLYTSAPLKTGVPTYEHFFCPDEVIETVSESPVIHSQPKRPFLNSLFALSQPRRPFLRSLFSLPWPLRPIPNWELPMNSLPVLS